MASDRMGRTRNYLRFVHESTIGVVAASNAGSSIRYLQIRETKDRYIAVPANENVFFWDLKTKQLINQLSYDADNAAEVSVIDCYHGGHPRTNLIAVGYANGHIRIFEYETGVLKTTLTGHRSAVTALCFDKDGSRLASGGKDCNIVLWDIVSEKGLFSLKGHKNCISKLAFLHNQEHQRDLIVSSSIDAVSTIKFWDLQLQHCFCTVPAQTSGVWSFALLRQGTRLVTGTAGPELKVYSIKFLTSEEKKALNDTEHKENHFEEDDEMVGASEVEYGLQVRHLGNIMRNTTTISNRVQDIIIDDNETLMMCHSIDKTIEFYALRSEEEALTYARKQAKKDMRKRAKRKKENNEDGDDSEIVDTPSKPTITSLDFLEPQKLVDCEFNRKLGPQKLSDKIKSLTSSRILMKDGSVRYKLAVVTSSNKVESFLFNPDGEKTEALKPLGGIESLSHRSDVRAICISEDSSMILSASAESAKVWQVGTKTCMTTIETDYATCCVFSNAKNITANYDNRFAFIGTKRGSLQIVDIAEAIVIETIEVCADGKPLNSLCTLPDNTGLLCGGEDGVARFYSYVWKQTNEDGQNRTNLSLQEDRSFPFQEGITCVKVSSNNKLMAVALLDSTVRVHFVDTFKYFLTMYGHKFPVTTMNISDDDTLLVTGSADKNIKIWGLDFGDCHKSIFAHDDAITCVSFVPRTHHVFSCGRDKNIKQWDCDLFIKIQTLRKHMAEIWCLSISPNGKYLVTGSHDKSIRIYRKTEEILVPSEEEEAERELQDERNVFEKQENIIPGEINVETGFALKMTIDTVKSTDRLIEAIDVFSVEQEKHRDYKKQCEDAESKNLPKPAEPERDPLLMTAQTTDYNRYMLETMRRIKPSELEEILLTLPFDYVRKLLTIIAIFLDRRWDVELMVRCATFLLKVNFGQIAASPTLFPVVNKLREIIIDRTTRLREFTGFNLMALEHLSLNRKYQSTKVKQGSSISLY